MNPPWYIYAGLPEERQRPQLQQVFALLIAKYGGRSRLADSIDAELTRMRWRHYRPAKKPKRTGHLTTYTGYETTYIISNFGILLTKEIAEHLDRTPGSIRARICWLRKTGKLPPYTPILLDVPRVEDELLKGIKPIIIAKMFGVHVNTIGRIRDAKYWRTTGRLLPPIVFGIAGESGILGVEIVLRYLLIKRRIFTK